MTFEFAAQTFAPIDALLADGRVANIRLARADDRDELLDLHHRASESNSYRRFFTVNRDAATDFVATVCAESPSVCAITATVSGHIVGLATAIATRDGEAEVALFVDDSLHGVGVGTLLLEHLVGLMRASHVMTLVADVLATNAPMLNVFRDAGYDLTTHRDTSVVELRLSTAATDASVASADRRERRAEHASLLATLEPQSVAVAGVSRDRGSVGREILENIRSFGFGGRLVAVGHPDLDIDGVECVAALSEVAGHIDLVVIAVPAEGVDVVVKQAADHGAGVCVIVTAGFGESGAEGQRQQSDLVYYARSHAMRLIGPNCFGVVSTLRGTSLNATFSRLSPTAGGLGLASQSGGVGIAVLDMAQRRGVGVASFVSLGNKADVSGNDLIAAWTDDPDVRVGALYLESFGNPRKFARLSRRFSETKPLLAVVGGRSAAGQRAGASHTAASLTSDRTVKALFEAAGIIAVSSVSDLVATAAVLLHEPRPCGRRVAIVSNAGGLGILAADAAQQRGITVPALSPETEGSIRAAVPGTAGVGNPIDLGAVADASAFAETLAQLRATGREQIDAVLAIVASTAVTDVDAVVAAIDDVTRSAPWSTMLVVVGRDAPGASTAPQFGTVEEALSALDNSARYAEWRAREEARIPESAPSLPNRTIALDGTEERWLDARDCGEVLGSVGITTVGQRQVADSEGALDAASALGLPVVLKTADSSIVHKSDLNLVQTGLSTLADVAGAYADIVAACGSHEVLVQEEARGTVELAIGIVNDPGFGSLLMLATGGVNIDVWDDQVFMVPPIGVDQAQLALQSLRSWPLIRGHRGDEPCDIEAIVSAIVAVGNLAAAMPQLLELDLNPVIAGPRGVSVVDVKMRVAPSSTTQTRHVDDAPQLSQH